MKTLTELIQNYQNGIPDSDSEILKRMEPLVKGYASRIHEYSCAVTPQVRQTGNHLSGLAGIVYASLLA